MQTITHGRLHFDDLEPIRFEELVLLMIYRMRKWEKLDHFGKLGSDDGVDIRALELLENNKRITYHYQCKRYSSINYTQLRKIADDYLQKNDSFPDYYIIVVSCSVTKKVVERFEAYCSSKGFPNVEIWTQSLLEAILFSDYHDLLFAFFGINLIENRTNLENSIRRNIALKKRMRNDFYLPPQQKSSQERMESARKPWLNLRYSSVLIRSITDSSYPFVPSNQNYIQSGFYKADLFDFYHNGIRVLANPFRQRIKIKARPFNQSHQSMIVEVEVLGCIPFENIIDYDTDGDEFYSVPHIFCNFTNLSNPYEKICYRDINTCIIYRDEEIISTLVE